MSMEEKNEYRYEYKGHTDDFILTNENYYSREAQEHYISIHTYLDIMGSLGRNGCEARGMATLNGLYKQEDTTALLVGSKEEEPDIAIIGLQDASGGNMLLDNALNQIENNADTLKSILTGEIEPMRCNRADCMYCRSTKQLSEPIFYQDLITM